jgi:Kdo2-lipid IVA lauroyltransferase/acyltransferase
VSKARGPYPEFLVATVRGGLAWLFRIVPRRVRWGMANALGWIWFDLVRFRRRLVLENLATAFPEASEAWRRQTGRRSVQHLCYSAIETFLLPFLNAGNFRRHIAFHGLEHVDRALAHGKGVLLLACHLGNVEVEMAAVSLQGFRVHVIAKFLRNRFLNQLVFGTRKSFGTRFIDPHGSRTAFDILHACRRNELVAFVIDQAMRPQYGVEATFFGRPAGTPVGLALFAVRTGAPVVPAYAYRDGGDVLHVVFEPAEEPPVERGSRDDHLQRMTQNYNHRIEAMIRRHPEQWMWVHRRWKQFGNDAARAAG